MRKNAPFSEDVRKQKELSSDQCLDELRRIVEANPERVVSRNFFRVNSSISENTWNRYFGTFAEYKRQAGVVLTRQQHAIEKAVAKHASVAHYKDFDQERKSWGAKYERKNKRRYQAVLFCSDFHDRATDPFALQVLIDTVERLKPDVLCIGGDLFDLPEFGRYTVDPREWDVVGRIKFAHEKILAPLRDAAPDAQFDFIEANHEHRLLRHLCDATPALRAVLADLHGFTLSKLLGLDEFQINYIAKCDLATYNLTDQAKEIKKNYKVYFDSMIAHHYPAGASLGMPGINGHHHKVEIRSLYNETFGAYQWVQAPAMHRADASYTMGEKWSTGFVIAHVDTLNRQTIFEPVSVRDFACVGGRYLYRETKNDHDHR